ncbi:ribosome biogenesis protein Nop53/GLTSCR2 [Pilobolus umbonatus]|nr:ribosome biogenesis protein Nop53/GLTSCR2 [Pilobolus umbonatus]
MSKKSRKGKKEWRKNVDITPIEEGQEELRATERTFGHTNELKDTELFTIDVQGDQKVKQKLAKDKVLRADIILTSRTAVPAVQSKNVFKKVETTDRIVSRSEERIVKRKLTNNPTPIVNKKKKNTNASKYDLWEDTPMEETNDYLPVKAIVNNPIKEKTLGVINLPAVSIPDGGISYNPTVEEHQKLLASVHDIEVRKAEVLKKLQEQLSYREELKLLAGDLLPEEEEGEEEEEEEKIEKKETGARKTKAERRKEQRKAREHYEMKQKEQDKSIRRSIDQLNAIEKELIEKENDIKKNDMKKKQAKDTKESIKKLGKYEVPDLPIDYQLTEELCESLRQLKVN